jgi:hypothetical protein
MITMNPSIHPALPHQSTQNVSVDLHSDTDRVSEWLSILQYGRPNLLIVGSAIQNERVLEQVHPMLRAPVAWWSPVERPEVPAIAFRALIVRHVECLTAGQQVSFGAWLRRSPDVQIVSIATMPVFPLVKEGTFLEELYYLLNVVLLEI